MIGVFWYYNTGKREFGTKIVNTYGYKDKWKVEIDRGIHSFDKPESAKDYIVYWTNYDVIVVECIIPKGSKYYTTTDGKEIVSNNLIIPK